LIIDLVETEARHCAGEGQQEFKEADQEASRVLKDEGGVQQLKSVQPVS
jgi:hypothetical protein